MVVGGIDPEAVIAAVALSDVVKDPESVFLEQDLAVWTCCQHTL